MLIILYGYEFELILKIKHIGMQCLDRNSGFGQKQQIFYQYLRTSSEEEGLVNLHQVFVNSSGNKQNADYTRALPGQ